MKTLTVIQHVPFEDLGTFRHVAEDEGYAIESRQAGVDGLATDADLLVIMGGPIGAYEADPYPFLTAELTVIESRLREERPTLGVCLGAQLMAKALGARVYGGHGKEIGWSPVTLTDAGRQSPLRALEGVPVLHWHGDTFDLPAGAVLLASTDNYRHQAFTWGPNVLALQFHPEVEARRLEQWLIGHACELSHAGIDLAALRKGAAEHGETLREASTTLFREWVRGLLG